MIKKINCVICESPRTKKFLDLGYQPNGNELLKDKHLDTIRTKLLFYFCSNCFSIFQNNTFSDQEMYSDHPYLTSHNKQYVQELRNFAELINHEANLTPGDLVLDIGCNDGSLLKIFKELGCSVLGVDPSATAYKYSKKSQIPVLQEFWNSSLANKLIMQGINPKLIVSTASFYHVSDIIDWMTGVSSIMRNDSYFAAQFVYSPDIIINKSFDQFYHEHKFLHSINSINALCRKLNLEIIFLSKNPSQGGSNIVVIKKKEKESKINTQLMAALDFESTFFSRKQMKFFLKSFKRIRKTWKLIAKEFVNNNQKLIGIGASLRGISFINFLDLNPLIFDCIFEVNNEKIGCWTSGKKIAIVSEQIDSRKTDYYLLLAWTQKDILHSRFANLIKEGKTFIIPVPKFQIIGPDPLNLKVFFKDD
jgi:SAM-dependent methyltransferase